jgi:hypothetical protein
MLLDILEIVRLHNVSTKDAKSNENLITNKKMLLDVSKVISMKSKSQCNEGADLKKLIANLILYLS